MRRVKSIPKRPGSEGASGGTFFWGSRSFCSLLHRPGQGVVESSKEAETGRAW